MDFLSPEKRSSIMASIRSKNTKPELLVRSGLHRLGLRFLLHSSKLPGRPDIVLPRHRAVVWVHGCFWHGHGRCRSGEPPASNTRYWLPKIQANRKRNASQIRKLKRLGWRNFVIWECQTESHTKLQKTLNRLAKGIRKKL